MIAEIREGAISIRAISDRKELNLLLDYLLLLLVLLKPSRLPMRRSHDWCRASQSAGEARQDGGLREKRASVGDSILRSSSFPSPFYVLLVGLSRLGVSNGPASTRLHVKSDRTFLPDRHTASKWSNGKHAIEPIDDAWARQEDSVQDW